MTNILRSLYRERALLLDGVESVLVLLVAFGLNLTADNQTAIVAAVVAALAFAKAAATSPFPVTLLTDLTRAVVIVFAGFGLDLPADRIALAATSIGTLITLVQRAQISPSHATT